MIGTLAVVVIGEVFFHYARTQSHCSEDGGMPVCMVAEAKDEVRPHLVVNLEHVEVDAVEVAISSGVVGVALHQH